MCCIFATNVAWHATGPMPRPRNWLGICEASEDLDLRLRSSSCPQPTFKLSTNPTSVPSRGTTSTLKECRARVAIPRRACQALAPRGRRARRETVMGLEAVARFENASCGTIRLKLLNIGALVSVAMVCRTAVWGIRRAPPNAAASARGSPLSTSPAAAGSVRTPLCRLNCPGDRMQARNSAVSSP